MQWIVDQDALRHHRKRGGGGDEAAESKVMMDMTEDVADDKYAPIPRIDNMPLSEQYSHLKFVQAGGFGEVYYGRRRDADRTPVALKIIRLPDKLAPTPFLDPLYEVEVAMRIQCGTDEKQECAVVPIYDAWVMEQPLRLIIEQKWIAGGDGFQLITRRIRQPALWLPFLRRNFITLAATLSAIHRQCVLHRDIKPENLLYEQETQRLYFADFGLSCGYPHECNELRKYVGHLQGTRDYLDPRLYLYNRIQGSASDIYALGVTMYELILHTKYNFVSRWGGARFPTLEEVAESYNEALKNIEEERAKDVSHASHVMFDLIRAMMHPISARRRPTLDSIVHALQSNSTRALQFAADAEDDDLIACNGQSTLQA